MRRRTGQGFTTAPAGNEHTFRAGATNFLLSPLGVTREKDGTTTTRTTRTPDGKVAASHGTTAEYFVTDHLGSVVGLFSPSGTWTGGYSYTPYGERRFAGPGTSANNWRYIGSDEELASFYNLSARHYDATIGRFTQMDPTGQEPNPYTYAQANPCNNSDPTGRRTCAEAVALLVLSAAAIGIAIGPFGALLSVTGGVATATAISATGDAATLGVGVGAFFLAVAVGDVVDAC